MDRNQARERLEEEKEKLDLELDVLAQEGAEAEEKSEEEEADPVDEASVVTDSENRESVALDLEARLEEVEAALVRVHNGTYGICRECGVEIPAERLETDPAAATCIEHC